MRLQAKVSRATEQHHPGSEEPTTGDAAAADRGVVAGAARGNIAWFVGLAFGFSWAWLIPLALTGRRVSSGAGWPTHAPAEMGPLLAAVCVTAWQQGRPGVADLLKRMVRFKGPPRWWMFAVTPLMLLVAVLIADLGLREPLPSAGEFAMFSGLPSAWGVIGIGGALLLMAFGEEAGWRGYALPHLQYRCSPLRAAMIVAAIWTLWHAPMFLVVDTYRSFNAAITVGWTIGLFCGAVVLSWLYNGSNGSILLVAVWHASYNLISGTNAAEAGLLAATSTTLVIALAITLVGLEIHAGRRGRRSVLAPDVAARPAQRLSRASRNGGCAR